MSIIERDKRIVNLREAGMTCADIGRIFGITATRVHQICGKQKRKAEMMADPVCALLVKADRELGHQCGTALVTRTYNVMRRRGIADAESLADANLLEIAHTRNAGVKAVALAALAQEMARKTDRLPSSSRE